MIPERSFHACAVIVALLGAGCGAKAPVSTFPELRDRIQPGHTVYVIDTAGRETRGKVVAVSDTELAVTQDQQIRRFIGREVRQVQRYGDPLWNGAIIGAVVALPGSLIADPQYVPCESDPRRTCSKPHIAGRAAGVGLSALLGMGIDALIRHRHPVYAAPGAVARSVQVRPMLTPRAAGLAVAVKF